MSISNLDQIAAWHRDPPEWAKHLTGRDWDVAELIAEELQCAISENVDCPKAPAGHYCAHEKGHAGPCRIFVGP